jgi:hypothetical protein
MPFQKRTRRRREDCARPSTTDALFASLCDRLDLESNEAFLGYAADPVAFCRDLLGVGLWQRQQEILTALATPNASGAPTQIAVKSGHGVGKTFLAAAATLWWLYSHAPCLVVTTAPSKRQVERVLWDEIRRLFFGAKVPLGGRCMQTRLDAGREQQAFGFTAGTPEQAAGSHAEHLLVIVDEASGVEDSFFEVLHGATTSAHTALLLIGNPTRAQGQFFECFRTPGWRTFSIPCATNPNFQVTPGLPLPCPWLTTPAWVESRRVEWGEDSDPYRVRVLGEFPKDSPSTLIPLSWVEAAEERGRESECGEERDERSLLSPQNPRLHELVLGVDVARYGDCETVMVRRLGDVIEAITAWQGSDLAETTGKIIAAIRDHAPTLVQIDAVGIGAGVVDHLLDRQREDAALKNTRILGFESGRTPYYPEFSSRRDEAYWHLRERYRDGLVTHAGDWKTLTGQLTRLNYRYNSRGKLAIESKEELRRRKIASPDWADAVMLAFALSDTGAEAGISGHSREAPALGHGPGARLF